MMERKFVRIISMSLTVGRDTLNNIWSCGGIFLLVVVLFLGCSSINKNAKQSEVAAGQITPQLEVAVQRINELFLQVEGKPRRQFTHKRTLPDGGSETISYWNAPGGMKATKPGMFEMDGVSVTTKVSPSGESKTERFDLVTRFTTDPKNTHRVVCYELKRPQGSRGDFKIAGPWDVKVVGSDGIWIGYSADVARRLQAGGWLSSEWHATPSGEVLGIRQYLGEPYVIVTETSATP